MKITIHGEFTDLNKYIDAERGNRYSAAKLKKQNMDDAMKQLVGNKKAVIPCKIKFLWITKDERVDADNVCFAKKFLLDSLVKKGVLKNDSRKYVKGFIDDFDVDKNDPRVEIEFLEV